MQGGAPFIGVRARDRWDDLVGLRMCTQRTVSSACAR
jgi:hypothetical protein